MLCTGGNSDSGGLSSVYLWRCAVFGLVLFIGGICILGSRAAVLVLLVLLIGIGIAVGLIVKRR